jgi:hypothetical protein
MTEERQVGSARAQRSIVQRVRTALAKMFKSQDAYHPEQHYMRGRPGPKTQAKAHHDGEK